MTYSAPIRDMQFVIADVVGLERIASLPGLESAENELVGQILEEAGKLSGEVLAPLNHTGDRQGVRLENGVVRTPDGFADAYAQFVNGGWNGVPFEEDYGGMGLPWLVATALQEMWQGANMAFGLCPLLTQAAIDALREPKVAWRGIAWRTCLLEALAEAQRTGRPVITWCFIDRPIDDERC